VDPLKGECFECKIQPVNLDDDDIINLNEIYLESDYSITPCIACFALAESIEEILKGIALQERNVITRNITIFGSEHLKSIPHFGSPQH
jgi:hypothetical protein